MVKKLHITELHIGKMVAAELDRQGRKVEWLARQIPCDKSNAYKMLKRPDMDLSLLFRISRILDHDFFADLSCLLK